MLNTSELLKNISSTKEPFLSIIVPAYKAEASIMRCLQSILQQSFQDFEIIVVYKNSNDKTLNIIDSLNESRIKIIEQTENTGPGGARNIGVDNATGKWIGFVEADDEVEKDFYDKLITVISDDVDIICGEILANGQYMVCHKNNRTLSTFSEKYKLIKNGATFNKIFRKSLIINHNIKCSNKIRWEDNIFIFKAFYYANKIKTVSNAVYYYNVSPWSDEYKAILQNDVGPETREIVEFINEAKFNYFQRDLAYHRIIKSFAGVFMHMPEVYSQLKSIMNSPYLFFKLDLRNNIKKIKYLVKKRK